MDFKKLNKTFALTRNAYISYDMKTETIIDQNSQASCFDLVINSDESEKIINLCSVEAVKYYINKAYKNLWVNNIAYISVVCSENQGGFLAAGLEIGFLNEEKTEIFLILTPIRDNRIAEAKMNEENDQYFKVMQEISTDILFKIDVSTKTVAVKSDVLDKYGISSAGIGFPDALITANLIYKDDVQKFRKFADEICNFTDAKTEVRINVKDKGLQWYEFEAIADDGINKNEVMGKAVNVTHLKNQQAQINELRDLNNADDAIIACADEMLEGSTSIVNLLAILASFFEGDFAYIYKRDFLTNHTRMVYHYDNGVKLDDRYLESEFLFDSNSETTKEISNKEYIYLNQDKIKKSQFKDIDKLFPTDKKDNILVSPLVIEGEVMGIIGVNNIKKNLKYLHVINTVLGFVSSTLSYEYSQEKLNAIINYDAITGFVTERKFILDAEKAIKKHPEKNYMIVAFDVDNFKHINEIYGYEKGTELIQTLAYSMQFSEDIIVSRTFADNFLILTQKENLKDVYDGYFKVNDSTLMEMLNHVLNEEYNFSFSVGAYNVDDMNLPVTNMIDCAIIAKNIGKKTYGDTFYCYSDEMRREREINNEIVMTMHNAIENSDFVVYFQPKIKILDEKLIGAEALVRWFKDGKMVPPNDFIPVFEKNGFIEKLDYYVLESVCKFISKHKSVPVISVNLSGITLLNDIVVDKIKSIITQYNVDPKCLEIEITESAFVNIYEKNILKLDQLREFGLSISMDDFGTGVSSLSRLNNIPIDVLKIDRSFIMQSTVSKRGESIIKTIISLAKELHLESIAEGVETKEEVDLLRKFGCDIIQGYYYSRPLPQDEFKEKYGL